MTATPRPWKAEYSDFDGKWCVYPTDEAMGGPSEIGTWAEIATCNWNNTDGDDDESAGKDDAALIVRAVNSHDQLVEALEACRLSMTQAGYSEKSIAIEGIDAALKAAKGEA